jgi:Protein of unknown function (DUF1592)/Protein of unknown function (DUF1588)/Protein of unknown function (DUF1585)/Protein of unknown function (DUF1587)/Protein of unknown function (DUF1595)
MSVVRGAKLALSVAVLAGCTGSIGAPRGTDTSGGSGGNGPSGPGAGRPPDGSIDPGRVGIHRLNNTEYNNTVRDLLATTSRPAETFLAEEGFGSFDNTASALGMTPGQYEAYLGAASDLMTEALASPTERARFMTCSPSATADPCARQIIGTFGARIYRRPLDVTEVDRAMKVYDADFTRGKDGTAAIGQALRAMLSAANFLYRIEYDVDPASTTPHPVSSYEMASRLSYLHWSSMPDALLFDDAKNGKLLDPAALETTVDRMVADPKSNGFVESFAGQWLGIRKLITHSVTAQVFPTYTAQLSDAMMSEGYSWFNEFLAHDRSVSEWFTADFNFVNDVLAQHYGLSSPGTGSQLTRVEVTTDQRQGFLGLASFLTETSFPSRTSPTLRGAWVLTELLCDPPPPPPPEVPKLDETADPTAMNQAPGAINVRARLEAHRAAPACAACHNTLDPIGLGLERYDGIGRYREIYPNGDAIVPEGQLPDGTKFSGPNELGTLLGKDPRFTACVSSKLYTYALGREIEALDNTTIARLPETWAARGLTIKNLIKEVVQSDAFRFRRGESG